MSLDRLANTEALADEALENLVNQFTRPMDFLRELVQNAIDAGTPRVEVWVAHVPSTDAQAPGLLEIHVDDFGEGMDEEIIDTQITRMFSSTKEDDLTKIGKFGIGFTSIFAIEPEAVLLRTGRHGESWELLFHADRSFDKIRIDTPVDGTRITLFKNLPDGEVERFVRELRWILGWWCEHSDTPITFEDRTGRAGQHAAVPQGDADPFAAFAGPSDLVAGGPEPVSRPFAVDADLSERLEEDGVTVIVGYGPQPRFAFYNGGLTLLNTTNPDALEPREREFGHLVFKVKYNRLEHTLTRDNVLKDEHWLKAMGVLDRAARRLRQALLDHAGEVARGSGDLDPWHRHLAAECRATDAHEAIADFARRCPFRDWKGEAVSLAQVADQERQVGSVLVHHGEEGLARALEDRGIRVLADSPAARDLLAATEPRGNFAFRRSPRRIVRAHDAFVFPQLVDAALLPEAERRLVEAASRLLADAVGDSILLRVGSFGGPRPDDDWPLALEGPADGGVFQRAERTWFRLPTFLRKRCLLVNRHHPSFRTQAAAAGEQADLAALALLHGVLHEEGLEPERTYTRLVGLVGDRLVDTPDRGTR